MNTTLIIGGSGGIGFQCAICEAEKGKDICIIDKSPPRDSKQYNFRYLECDLSCPSRLQEFICRELKDTEISGLIHCAGIREVCSLTDLSFIEWQNIFNVNVTSFFLFAKGRYNNFIQGASLVSLSSVSGLLAEPKRTAYVSSKHAMIGLTKCLAIELAEKKVRVNSVAPGVIKTPMTHEYYHDEVFMNKINQNHILGRTGTPEEVAEVQRP